MKRAWLFSFLLALPLMLQAQRVSYVRIVRISLVEGPVSMNVHDGQGWRPALLNAPVAQRTQLRTAAGGRVEVQFEDGSTVQLIPHSEIDFTTLSLINRERHNGLTLVRGSALFTLHPHDSEAFVLRFPGGFATVPHGKAWFRVDLSGTARTGAATDVAAVADHAVVRVFDGNVVLQTNRQIFRLHKDDQLTLNASAPPELVKNKELDVWDEWSHQREEEAQVHGYHPHHAPIFGFASLNSAGTWSNGCWTPSIAGAGWSPYMNGSWLWNPALGYSWVSSYAWGWLPYHYGSWLNSGSGDWCWSPGTSPMWYYYPQPQFIAAGGAVPYRPPMPMPPKPVRTMPGTLATSSTLVQMNRTELQRPVLRLPPANLRRIYLPPAMNRVQVRSQMRTWNPAQRAAFDRAVQSRNWQVQQIRQQEMRQFYMQRSGMQSQSGQPAMQQRSTPMQRQSMPTQQSMPMPRSMPMPSTGGRPH